MSSSVILPTPLFSEQRSGSKKRSQAEAEKQAELDRRPFAIRASNNDPFAAPRIFKPVTLVPRARLQLAYLDPTHAGSRIFSSHIHSLEAAYERENDVCVLIAQDLGEGRLYAVERVKTRTYALCRLASWLSDDNIWAILSASVLHDEPQRKRRAVPVVGSGQPWWICAAVDHLVQSKESGSSNATIPNFAMLAGPADCTKDTKIQLNPEPLAHPKDVPRMAEPDMDLASGVAVSPQDQLQELAKHYLEALYSSRAPLAYFIKGPLSRARTAFINDDSPSLRAADLLTFLRDSILSSSIIDKKYRDIVPNLVKDLSLQESATPEVPKTKRKKKWKAKRDKAGLFCDETDYIKIWWSSDDSGATSAEAQDSVVRRRCASIRSRETYLQVILALEVLALEASIESPLDDPSDVLPDESQGVELQGEDLMAAKHVKKPKLKKAQDLVALLDSSIDKLCIWHSLQASTMTKQDTHHLASNNPNDNDELVNFCRDNVIPFFMSRIPKIATMVNKKLGGPAAPTPAKHTPMIARKPGEPATRPHHQRPTRRPFARVATETTGLAPKQVATLYRSATDIDTIALVKREPSQDERSSNGPSASSRHPAPRRRLDLARSMSISGREVDFSAMSQANEIKLRKKADLKERLRKEAKEAIDAIRKPNRQLATKEYAEETDLSFAKATAKDRPSHKYRPGHVTQVDATPAKPRLIHPTPHYGRDQAVKTSDILSSGQTIIPGSSAKLRAGPYDLPPNSSAVPSTVQRARRGIKDVLETPSRGFAKFMPSGLVHPPGMLDSPDAMRHAAIQQTPSKPMKQLLFSSEREVKSQAAAPAVHVSNISRPPELLCATSPNLREPESENQRRDKMINETTSVYASLGWDEDYEELS